MDFPIVPFVEVSCEKDFAEAANQFEYPFYLKKRCNSTFESRLITTDADLESVDILQGSNLYYGEQHVDFEKEVSVVVVSCQNGPLIYPITEIMKNKESTEIITVTPANVTSEIASEINILSKRAVSALSGFGVHSVHFFVGKDGTLYLHKIVPRYYTLDCL